MSVMQLSSKKIKTLAGLSIALLLISGVSLLVEGELSRPWKKFQRQFIKLDDSITAGERRKIIELPDSAAKKEQLALLDTRQEGLDCRRLTIKQLWLTDLGTTDRCMSCHLGVESPRFVEAAQPFTTHPGRHLAADRHPVEKFGCVSCHDGQGVALTVKEAHAETDIWLKPILRRELAEASCRRCHTYDDKVPQHLEFPDAPHLTNGKRLYLEKGCLGCHILQGFEQPKRIAPILTRVTEKVNNGWMKEWISKPKEYLPLTIMPFFELKEKEVNQIGAFLNAVPGKETAAVTINGEADAGKKLIDEIGCLACHSIGENGGIFGPDLNRVAEKIKSDGWLVDWLDNPAAFDPETEMPDFRLNEKQIQDLGAYIITLRKKENSASVSFSSDQAEAGKELFATLGCTGCHKMDGMDYGFRRSPEHTGFADKEMEKFDFGHITDIPHNRAAWIKRKLEQPRSFSTETIQLVMPDFELPAEEIRDLRVWLLSMGEREVPEVYRHKIFNTDDPFIKGMRIVERFNCIGCHQMGLVAKEMELNDDFPDGFFWAATSYATDDIELNGKVLYPKGSEIGEEQVAELLLQDPEIDNILFKQRWFVDYDGVGYLMDMGLKKMKVLGIDEGDIMTNYKDLNFAPPILNYEGMKVQSNWLYEFLDNPYPIRPLTKATMPTFNFSRKDMAGLVAFFAAKEGLANPYFAVGELGTEETDRAEQVFKICLQCHYFDQARLHDKKGFADLKGPNLAEVKRRLRPKYIRQWVKFPDLIVPTTQMKNFFYEFDVDNRFEEISRDETGITDISQEEKIDMMARFLMNPYKNAKLSIQR